jgi:hypothetical protein
MENFNNEFDNEQVEVEKNDAQNIEIDKIQAPQQNNNIQNTNTNNAFGIACLVCGILSLLCCCCSCGGILGYLFPIAAIVLFILERTVAKQKTGLATAGLICGIISLIISIIGSIVSAILLSSGFMEMLESVMSEAGLDMSSILGEF